MSTNKRITLSPDQEQVMDEIEEWWDAADPNWPRLTFGGLAGTGKTTITAMLKERLGVEAVAYCAPTGKAASVLRGKLSRHGSLGPLDTIQTMHQLLYVPDATHCRSCPVHKSTTRRSFSCHVGRGGGRYSCCRTEWIIREGLRDGREIIVCDEASMVGRALYKDVMALDLPTLFVGDHGQLPPVNDSLGLMEAPDVCLETVHRQVADSPIIKLAMHARLTGEIPFGKFGDGVGKYHGQFSEQVEWSEEDADDVDTLTLCYTNETRVRTNALIRESIGRPPDRPVRGDRVVCLRNNHEAGIHNGMVGQILDIERETTRDDAWAVSIEVLDGEGSVYEGLISREQFGAPGTLTFQPFGLDQWDYGYCLTVHKAQGSEAREVYLIEERPRFVTDDDYKRWLYTAVTRATEELYILKADR